MPGAGRAVRLVTWSRSSRRVGVGTGLPAGAGVRDRRRRRARWASARIGLNDGRMRGVLKNSSSESKVHVSSPGRATLRIAKMLATSSGTWELKVLLTSFKTSALNCTPLYCLSYSIPKDHHSLLHLGNKQILAPRAASWSESRACGCGATDAEAAGWSALDCDLCAARECPAPRTARTREGCHKLRLGPVRLSFARSRPSWRDGAYKRASRAQRDDGAPRAVIRHQDQPLARIVAGTSVVLALYVRFGHRSGSTRLRPRCVG
jgi:hypothetical protein